VVATQTLTFLFADIEGSAAMLARLGDVWAGVLADHHRLIRAGLAHGGEEVTSQRHGVVAVSTSPQACADAAIQMQRARVSHAWPTGERVRVRMGIHSGEACRTAAGPSRLEAHRAAPIAAVAHGGQVVVSGAAAGLLAGWLPTGVGLTDLGRHWLAGGGRAGQVFQLRAEGLSTGFLSLWLLEGARQC
jgi:class 3 adenylate cyclase